MRRRALRKIVSFLTATGVLSALAVTGVVGGGIAPASAALPKGFTLLADINQSESGGVREVATLGNVAFAAGGGDLFVSNGTGSNSLLKDFNPSGSDNVDLGASNGSLMFFAADDGVNGKELWKSDGTAVGTSLVKDLFPGADSSNPGYMFAVGSTMYFFTSKYDSGWVYDLWKTDGTTANTVLVKGGFTDGPEQWTGATSLGYFTMSTSAEGRELWVTNGTEAGTKLVKDIAAGAAGSRPLGLTAFGNKVAFEATDSGTNRLWVSDGTEAGTVALYTPTGGTTIDQIVNAQGTIYASTNTYSCSTVWGELVKSDGTVGGTSAYVSIPCSDSVEHGFGNMGALGSKIVVNHYTTTSGWELWVSDGTAAGTKLVKDLAPGTDGASPGNFHKFGNKALFHASLSDQPGDEDPLFITDGTEAGTKLLAAYGSYNDNLAVGTTRAYFPSDDDVHGQELWQTDGTEAGTKLGYDTNLLGDSGAGWLTVLGSKLLFAAEGTEVGEELYVSDGTPGGTTLLKDIRPGKSGSNPTYITVLGAKAIFAAYDGTNGTELWVTDGTAAGTTMLKDIAAGAGTSYPADITVFGSLALFTANVSGYGTELWVTDGTEAGTTLVKDIRSGSNGSYPGELTVVGSKAFFRADDGTNGAELWVTDGTAAGTTLVKDINATGYSNVYSLTAVGSTLFFTADDGTNGAELWKSDGTEAGTVLVKDINGSGDGVYKYGVSMAALGSTVFFPADDNTNGNELWKSDGTEAGTVLVKDINSGGDSYADYFVSNGSVVFFTADDGTHGNELWKTDGTGAGTVMVKDIMTTGGSYGSYAYNLTVIGTTLYLTADDDVHGYEPWVSDGTEAGTRLLADLNTGVGSRPQGSSPESYTDFNGVVALVATTLEYGEEVYVYGETPLTFEPPESLEHNADYTLAATSDSPGAITYVAEGRCQIKNGTNNVMRTKGTGTCTVTVNQAASAPYAASSVIRDIKVTSKPVTVTFNGFVTPIKKGPISASNVAATADFLPSTATDVVALQALITPAAPDCLVTFIVTPTGGGDPLGPFEAVSDDFGVATTDGFALAHGTYDVAMELGGPCGGSLAAATAQVFNGVELPATGANTTATLWMALGLITVGGALHLTRRTRTVGRTQQR